MSEWRIYRKNVNLSNVTDATAYVASVKVLEYRGTFLEDTQVSFDISSPTPISLAYGDKLSYRGETYVLRDPLAVEKVARRNSYGGAFKYENIVFRGLEWEMQNVEFTDVVPNDNNLHYTGLSTFSFYCDHPQKLIERVQACMDIAYTGTEAWTISLASGFDISQYSFTPQTISISSGTSCWAALGLLYKNWKIPFTRSGKTITVGASVVVTSTVEYGKGNGLMSIKRVPDTDVRVITRLRAYGSQKNMPYRYYNNKGFINEAMYMPYLMLPAVREHTAGDGHDVYLLSGNVENYGIIDGEVHFDGSGDNEEIYPTLEGMTTTDAGISAVTYDSTDKRLDRILSAQNPADNGVCADGDYDSDDAVDTDGVTIVKEFTMTIPYLGFDWKDKLTSEGQATIIMKSGMCAAREFTILEVNPVSESAPSQGSVLRMERINDDVTGYAYPNSTWTINAGDYFVIAGIEMDDVYVIAAENRLFTAASVFLAENDHPNYKYEPSIDNIWMQNHPTDAAKMRPGVKLSFSDTDLGISSGVVTIQTVTIDEGKRPLPEYQVVLNDNVTTTTLENLTAQVDAIMSGNAGVGGGISQSELMAQIRNVGGTLFLSKNNADTASGLIRFLQGITSDGQARLNGGATFGTAGNYGVTSAGDGTFDELSARLLSLAEGLSTTGTISAGTINTDVLNAKAAHFAQLIIDELRSAGGAYLLSAADCTIDYVETLNEDKTAIVQSNPSYYRCYYKANDNDGRTIYQKFEADDQVMHTTFDKADSGYHLTDNSNRYYWMIVDAVSSAPVTKTLDDGVEYPCHYIDINPSIASEDSNATPQVGDNLVLLGHQGNDTARQAAIYITAYTNSFDTEVQPPAIVFYQGVNDFTLSGKKPNYWGRDKVVITGNLKYSSTGSGTGTDVQDLINAGGASTTAVYQLEASRVVVKADKDGVTDEHVYLRIKKSQGGSVTYVSDKDYTFSIANNNATLVDKSGYQVNLNPVSIVTQRTSGTATDSQRGISHSATNWLFADDTTIIVTLKDGSTILDRQSITLVKDGQDGQDGQDGSDADQYVFSVAQDTKTITARLSGETTTYDQDHLDYTINLTIGGEKVTSGINSYLSIGTRTNCSATLQSNGVVRLSGFSTSVLAGGSVTINCYTSPTTHDDTTLWGVLTLKYNVEWSTYAMSVVDGKLTSYATKTKVNALGNRVDAAETNITQNADNISAHAGRITANETNISKLQVQANGISASVASQKYNSNLFGFTDGLAFTGACKPFIQGYGIEIVGANTYGYVTSFGARSVNGVTLSFYVKALSAATSLTVYVNGTNLGAIDVGLNWGSVVLTAPSETILNSISFRYPTTSTVSVAIKNLKVESGGVATPFCISDSDGASVETTNIFTTTVDYSSNPYFNRHGEHEVLDTTNTDGHGTVMQFYRNNNSSDTWMVFDATTEKKTFVAGKVYTLSFWAKTGALPSGVSQLKIHSGIWNGSTWNAYNNGAWYEDYTEGLFNQGESLQVLTPTWKRYFVRFYIMTTTTGTIVVQCNNHAQIPLGSNTDVYFYVADVRLEEAYIANDSDPMSVSGAQTRSEAKFNLTADNIELKLNNTGIDIEKNHITLDAEKTTVRGELLANKVRTNDKGSGYIDMTNGLMNVFNSNGINQLRFGVDENGNILLRYYKADGSVAWDLGPSGLEKSVAQDQKVVAYTWCLMKEWNGSSWVEGPDTLDEPSGIDILESFYSKRQNGSRVSYLAYLINNGISSGDGTVWQYEAFINAGQYIGGSGTYGDRAISAEAARKYDKIFLKKVPTSSDPLTLSGSDGTTGDTTSEWYADFVRIKKIEVWRICDMEAGEMITYKNGKSYVVPNEYAEGLNGFDVDWEVDTANGTYNDPPVCFYCQHYEYGVLKEDMPFWINSSQIEGL